MSKFDYFLLNREAARDAFEEEVAAFGESDQLLQELRIVYDWIAEEKGLMKISSRHFKQRLPEIHKKFPLLAANFARMDANGDCWLEWTEFAEFCLKDERLLMMMKRHTSIAVYGVDFTGARNYKDETDAHFAVDVGTASSILPWEKSHVVEWRIHGLQLAGSEKGLPVLLNGAQMRAGQSIASPPFRAAGVCGVLRFWPVNFWTEPQLRKKAAEPGFDVDKEKEGYYLMPGVNTWCCLGVDLPPGSHLQLKFYVGRYRSDLRECFWAKGTSGGQLWAPDGKRPPQEVRDLDGKDDYLTVGIEIIRNKGVLDRKPKLARVHHKFRNNTRPVLKPQGSRIPENSKLLSHSDSLPGLPRVGSSMMMASTAFSKSSSESWRPGTSF
mmetsp:Transcript_6949/g.12275  ORF Transcript_6949/g.12275 Transcript_6949/m.12275 type:complete len:383 (-) Transcript_6949:83-1231(-)